jgi:hypothetical protein
LRAIRPKLNYSNVVATIALFVALGGAAVAAGLPRHSVGAAQLKRGAVTAHALRKGAVKAAKLAKGSVIAGKLAPSSVLPSALVNGAVIPTKLAANAVTGPAIANGVVNASKLAANAVNTSKIANGAVTFAKLDSEVAPLLGTLRSGQTLRGVFDLGTDASVPASFVDDGVSFFFPLAAAPNANVLNLKVDEPTANCPGVAGGNQQTPNAAPGNLCVYITAQSEKAGSLAIENTTRLGFGLRANAGETAAGNAYSITGLWAVTAP